MPLTLFFALLLATPSVYATGSPLVLYLMGGELLALVIGLVWVVFAAKSWGAKMRAMVAIIICLIFVVLLHAVPDYLANQTWIEGTSVAFLAFTFAIVVKVLRKEIKGPGSK